MRQASVPRRRGSPCWAVDQRSRARIFRSQHGCGVAPTDFCNKIGHMLTSGSASGVSYRKLNRPPNYSGTARAADRPEARAHVESSRRAGYPSSDLRRIRQIEQPRRFGVDRHFAIGVAIPSALNAEFGVRVETDPVARNSRKPGDKTLTTTGTRVNDGEPLLYRASKADCDGCALRLRCCPDTPARKVPRSIHEHARDIAARDCRVLGRSDIAAVAQEGRDAVRSPQAHSQTRSSATARIKRRPRRVPPCGNRPEPSETSRAAAKANLRDSRLAGNLAASIAKPTSPTESVVC